MNLSELAWLLLGVVFVIAFGMAAVYFYVGFFARFFLFAFMCGEKVWLFVTWPIRRLFALVFPGKKKSKNEVAISWDDEDDSF